jgi:hypothetical protein
MFNTLEVSAEINSAIMKWPDVNAFMVQKIELSEVM